MRKMLRSFCIKGRQKETEVNMIENILREFIPHSAEYCIKDLCEAIIQYSISSLPKEEEEENPCDTCNARETVCEVDCVAHIQYTKAVAHNSCLSQIKERWSVK